MLARRGAWLLLAAGLVLGTLADERVITVPRRLNDGWILRADFHVHSFFGDGALTPWDLRREAERRGLDVIVITNHNQTATSRFAAWLAARSPGPLVITGEEITAPRYHLTTAGTTRTVDWRQPMSTVIDDVHAQGGIVIAAHPAEPGIAAFEDDARLQRLDGIEGPLPTVRPDDPRSARLDALFTRAARVHPGIAMIGSSDYHTLAPVGAYRTYLLARDRSADAVLDAVRRGRTVACGPRGRADGEATLRAAVAADCAAVAAGAYAPDMWSRVAFACGWLSLLILGVLAGPFAEGQEIRS